MVIYCTTNLINGKKYIGKDAANKKSYLGSGLLLNKAVKKYGRENFSKSVIQNCVDMEDLNESEIYWIDYFNATKSDLFYNLSIGGTGGDLGEVVRKKQSESHKKIKHPNRFKKGIGSKPYAKKISEAHKGKPKYYKRKPIIQLDLDGNFIKDWSCAKIAANELNIKRNSISRVCLGNRARYKNFKWKFKNDNATTN